MNYDLNTVSEEPMRRPPAIVVYGEPGIGKSTFLAGDEKLGITGAPSPIILDVEKSTAYLKVKRVFPETFVDVMGWLDSLLTGKHEYKTLGLETLDWLELLIHRQICEETKAGDILDKRNEGTAYGRGHVAALNRFLAVRKKLEDLRNQRGMAIVITAHTLVKKIDDPVDGGFDRHVLKVHEKICGACVEWADAVLFAKKEVIQTQNGIKEGDKRYLLTSGSLAATGKNRLHLPPKIPMSWPDFINNIGKLEVQPAA